MFDSFIEYIWHVSWPGLYQLFALSYANIYTQLMYFFHMLVNFLKIEKILSHFSQRLVGECLIHVWFLDVKSLNIYDMFHGRVCTNCCVKLHNPCFICSKNYGPSCKIKTHVNIHSNVYNWKYQISWFLYLLFCHKYLYSVLLEGATEEASQGLERCIGQFG